MQPNNLLSHTGQLTDPDGASGQLRTSMLLTGSRFLRRFENAGLMWLWSSPTVPNLFTPFHQWQRWICATTHQIEWSMGFPNDVYRDLQSDSLSVCQAPAVVAPLRSYVTNLQNPTKARGEYAGSSVRAQTFHWKEASVKSQPGYTGMPSRTTRLPATPGKLQKKQWQPSLSRPGWKGVN